MHQGLNLDVKRGEVLGVVGARVPVNLFCYAVLLGYVVRLRENSCFWQGFNGTVRSIPRQVERRFGVLFQRGALFSSLTGPRTWHYH